MKKPVTLRLTYDDADNYIVALMQASDILLNGEVDADAWDEDQIMSNDELFNTLNALQASISRLID